MVVLANREDCVSKHSVSVPRERSIRHARRNRTTVVPFDANLVFTEKRGRETWGCEHGQ